MPRVLISRSKAGKINPQDGKTLRQTFNEACPNGDITWQEFLMFNFGTEQAAEVNRALIEQIGADAKPDPADSVIAAGLGPSSGERSLLKPAVLELKNLAEKQTHPVELKPLLPAPAVEITKLDPWFIPGEETCLIQYRVEGEKERADKIYFGVYASNYCKGAAANDGKVTFTADADLEATPVFSKALKEKDAAREDNCTVPDWKGEVDVTTGVLAKRGDTARYINVACSPYTAVLRYARDAKHKDARLKLEPFWPVFKEAQDGTESLSNDPLEIKWKVEKCDAAFTRGQVIVFDADGEVFRRGLSATEISEGKFVWKPVDGFVKLAKMPYRAQITLNTGMDAEDGVALAAMHTEVRLYAHKDTNRQAQDPAQNHQKDTLLDEQSMTIALAPFVPAKYKAAIQAQTTASYKLKLAQNGYYPGPVNTAADADFKLAWREFQRSHAAAALNVHTRLPITDDLQDATKNAMDAGPIKAHAIFGKTSDRTDFANNAIDAELNKKGKNDSLIVWVNDRHYSTNGSRAAGVSADLQMGDYRGSFSADSAVKAAKDAESIARPWIPLEASPVLLSQRQKLWDEIDVSTISAELRAKMRAAVGPLRVNWRFTEEMEDFSLFDQAMADTQSNTPNFVRTKEYVREVIKENKKSYRGQEFFNCPEKMGGIRPDSLAAYYKAPFGVDGNSLIPWRTVADDASGCVCSLIHDDVGQDEKLLYPDCVGKAGAYLHPSQIAGDSYRLRIHMGFAAAHPDGDHPNRAVLQARYTRRPQVQTPLLRVWRKTSFRGHVYWGPNPSENKYWGTTDARVAIFYRPAFVHFVNEYTGGNGKITLTDLLDPSVQQDKTDFNALIRDSCTLAKFQDVTKMQLNTRYIWPWAHQPHMGVEMVPDNTVTLATYHDDFLKETISNGTWSKYYSTLMSLLIDRIEKRKGLLRGHVVVEFESSPRFWIQEYKCAAGHKNLLIEKNQTGNSADGKTCKVDACNAVLKTVHKRKYSCQRCMHADELIAPLNEPVGVCAEGCTGTMDRVTANPRGKPDRTRTIPITFHCRKCGGDIQNYETPGLPGAGTQACTLACSGDLHVNETILQIVQGAHHFGFSAYGPALGGVWVWCQESDPTERERTWAHEIGHNRHLVHAAGATSKGEDDGTDKDHHDSSDNPNADANEKPRYKGWDRRCLMSYYSGKQFFCGKCILKNRGWNIDQVTKPAAL